MFYLIGLHLYVVHALQYVMESDGVGDVQRETTGVWSLKLNNAEIL